LKKTVWSVVLFLVIMAPGTALGAYSEAPMLQQMVADGELPPVEERLPAEPLVIEPRHNVGEYGGTWNRLTVGEDWRYFRQAMYGHSLLRWTDDAIGVDEMLVKEWEANEDQSHWTMHFREGLRWSDGELFTTDDFMFWWEEMALHPEHSEAVPGWATTEEGRVEIVQVDDYTLRFEFPTPQVFFPEYMAMRVDGGQQDHRPAPKHYLMQFHPDYNDEYDTFEEFEIRQLWWKNPECPVLTEWMPVRHDPGQVLILERNPYYYGVDTEGNQLPYIDEVRIEFVGDPEVFKLRATRGESDMQILPSVLGMADISLIRAGTNQYGIHPMLFGGGSGTGSVYFPNQNHPDDARREVYQDSRFLRALSHAINRSDIQSLVYYDQGYKTTGTMSPNAREFHTETGQELFEQWRDLAVEYDPEKAEQLLDEVGVTDTTGDGYRNLPNGDEFVIRIEMWADVGEEYFDSTELVRSHWADVGIRTEINPVDWSALANMREQGTFDVQDGWEVGDGPSMVLTPAWLIPMENQRWAPLYGAWHNNIDDPIIEQELDKDPRDRTPPREQPDPDSPYARLFELYRKAEVEPDEEVRNEYVYEMLRIHIENGPFFIGTVANFPRVGVIRDGFKNVPDRDELPVGGYVGPWNVPFPGYILPAQFYIEQE